MLSDVRGDAALQQIDKNGLQYVFGVLAMASLKPRALEILLLHYKHDYSDAQIAELLGTSRGTIAVTLYRIRARLKTLLRSAGSTSRGAPLPGAPSDDGERT